MASVQERFNRILNRIEENQARTQDIQERFNNIVNRVNLKQETFNKRRPIAVEKIANTDNQQTINNSQSQQQTQRQSGQVLPNLSEDYIQSLPASQQATARRIQEQTQKLNSMSASDRQKALDNLQSNQNKSTIIPSANVEKIEGKTLTKSDLEKIKNIDNKTYYKVFGKGGFAGVNNMINEFKRTPELSEKLKETSVEVPGAMGIRGGVAGIVDSATTEMASYIDDPNGKEWNPIKRKAQKVMSTYMPKEVRKALQDKMLSVTDSYYKDYAKYKELESRKSQGNQYIDTVVEGTSRMVPSLATTFVTGNPNAGLVATGLSAKGSSTQEALRDGATLDQAITMGNVSMLTEMATEKIWSGIKLPGGKSMYGDALGDAMENFILSKLKSNGAKWLASKGMDIAGEIAEEFISDTVESLAKKSIYDKNAKLPTASEYANTAKVTAGTTVLLNLLTGGFLQTPNNTQNFNKTINQNTESQEQVQKSSTELAEKNNIPNLQQNSTKNQNTNQQQQIIQEQNKNASNQNVVANEKQNSLKEKSFEDIVDEAMSNYEYDEVKSPLQNRDIETIGKEKVNAYQYDNPEVKPFFQEMAKMLGEDVGNIASENNRKTIKGGGTSLNTNISAIKQLREMGYSYNQIIDGIANIIDDHGKENNAVSKKLEIIIDDQLRNGYINSYGKYISPNEEYINLINKDNANVANDFTSQQQTSQIDNKNNLNQNVEGKNETKFSKILNNKDLPQESYEYEKSDNIKIDSLRQQANKYFNNSPEAHNFVNMLEKIITDKNITINFDTNMAEDVNGYYNNGVITINPNSNRAGEFLAIHELTHAIGTDSMIKMIDNYRKSNAEFDSQVQKLLQKYNKSEISEEALADIAGQLFGNQEYINNLSKTNPSIFKRIYNEIKYLWHQFRGYKNQDQFVDDLMFKWEQAYRKNSQLNDTNRKSLVGESATLADTDKLKQAQKMEQSGMTADEIFRETGWYKGNEGKWRFELDDSNWNLKDIQKLDIARKELYTLNDILDAPELYEAYPELKNLPVVFDFKLDDSTAGALSTEWNGEKTLRLNPKRIKNTDIKSYDMLGLKNQPEIFETLQHEIQHYIQDKEGFSKGANPQYWYDEKVAEYAQKVKEILYRDFNSMENLDEVSDLRHDIRLYEQKMNENIYLQESIEEHEEALNNGEGWGTKHQEAIENAKLSIYKSNELIKEIEAKLQSKLGKDKFQELKEVYNEFFEFTKNRGEEAYQLYRNTAGEQEARNVEDRIKLTSEEKKNTLPFIKDENTVYAKDDVDAYSQREYISDTVDESEEKVYNRYHTNTLDEKVRLRSGSLLKNNIVAYDNGNYFVIHNLDYGKYAIQDVIPVSNKAQSEYIEKFLEEVENDYANGYRKTTNEMLRLPQNRFRSSQSSNVNANEQQSWTEFADSVLDEYERINGRRFNIQDEGDKRTNNEGLEKSSSFNLPKTDNQGNMLSKQQQEYFMDSKVRDENGKLLEVYHGTEANAGIPQEHWFTTFDLDHARPSTLGDGFYFTEDYERASSYAHSKGNVYKVYLNITNPFIKADNQTFSEAIREINPNYDIRKLYRNEHEASRFDGVKLRKYLIDNGYDGISLQGTYVAFYPEQIKNVNNQNPTSNPDIRYSKNSSTWQEYLEREFPAKGTRTNMQDIKQGTNLPTGKNVKETTNKANINLPPKVSANNQYKDTKTKIRKHYKSIIESTNTTPEAKAIAKQLMGTDTYIPETNKNQLEKADERISQAGPESELDSLMARSTVGDKITSVDIAVGERLIQYYSKTGDATKLRDAIQATAMAGTTAGQAVQAFSLLNHQTPEGQAVWLQRSVEKMNNDLKKQRGAKAEQLNLTDDMINKIMNSENSKELRKNLDEVYKELGQQVTKTTIQKIDAWRYFSMLANPRTHIRNIIGNFAMARVQSAKNKVAGVTEGVVSKFNKNMERTHTIVPASKDVKAFAKADIENVSDRLGLTEGKLNPKSRIESNMRTFKHKVLENTIGKAFAFNDFALEAEDGWGLKAGYTKALAEYMTANKLKPDTITDAQLAKARNYAVQQAKEATFHQDCQLATLINQLSNKNKFAKYTVDAILPFKKTPMNIAKTGFQYSPMQIAKSMVYDTVQLRKGNITVNQYIENVSKGLTGTGIALVGYALASMGIVKASGGDDDKEKYEQNLGKQTFSITVGDNTYSLDWLAPSAIPLFIGAEIFSLSQDSSEKKTSTSSDEDSRYNQVVKTATNVLDSFANSMNPMMEMSMLSGLTSALKSYEQGSSQMIASMGTNAVQSYVNQFFPTALGQIAKTTDEYERSTTSTKSGVLPKAIDTTKNQIMSKIPGLRQKLPVKTDIWGNEKKQSANLPLRAVENAIFPWSRKEISNSDVDKELERLYDINGNQAVIPDSSFSKDLTFSGQKYRMTSGEYANYRKTYGDKSYKLINELIKSNEYEKLTDEEKQTAVEKIYTYAKEYCKNEYAENNDIDYEQSKMFTTVQKLEKSNGNASSYFDYLSKTTDMKDKQKIDLLASASYSKTDKKIIYENTLGSDDSLYNNAMKYTGININEYLKYKTQEFTSDKTDDGTVNGKSVSGSKKAKVYDYVNKMKITGEQRMLLLGTQYKLTDSERATLADYVKNLNITKNQKIEIYKKLQGFTVYKDGRVTY